MKLTHYNTFENMSGLQNPWNTLLSRSVSNSPFLRFEFMKNWWDHKGGGEWSDDSQLFVIAANEGDQLIGIAPFFVALKDGKKVVYNLGAIEICDILDVIAEENNHAEFVQLAIEYLLAEHTDINDIRLFNLPSETKTAEWMRGIFAQKGFDAEISVYQPSPTIHLSTDFETYLSGIDKKQRHEIRRKMRRAEESGRGVRWFKVETEEQLKEAIVNFFQLMEADSEKALFLTPKMKMQMSSLMNMAFEQNYLHFAFLEADGKTAAAYLMFDYNNKLWVYNSGYDRNYNDLSVGWVLLGHLIEWSCINGRAEFDFMRGNEDYKFKFGAVDRPVLQLIATRN